MKKLIILAIMAIVVSSCNKNKKMIDPVLDLPVQHEWDSSTLATIDSISYSPSILHATQLLEQSNLGEKIFDYLGIKEGKIEYFMVKAGDTVKVKTDMVDTIGVLYKNQLLVRITKDGNKVMYFVHCMNGMVSPIKESYTFLGEEVYILSKGEGPMHHGATYSQVWDMAERANLVLTAYRTDIKGLKYRVRDAKSLQDFKNLSSKYGLVRINTLQPGDRLKKTINNSWHYLGQ